MSYFFSRAFNPSLLFFATRWMSKAPELSIAKSHSNIKNIDDAARFFPSLGSVMLQCLKRNINFLPSYKAFLSFFLPICVLLNIKRWIYLYSGHFFLLFCFIFHSISLVFVSKPFHFVHNCNEHEFFSLSSAHPVQDIKNNNSATKKFYPAAWILFSCFFWLFFPLLDQKFNDLFKYLAC